MTKRDAKRAAHRTAYRLLIEAADRERFIWTSSESSANSEIAHRIETELRTLAQQHHQKGWH